jgi:hypothetical protein
MIEKETYESKFWKEFPFLSQIRVDCGEFWGINVAESKPLCRNAYLYSVQGSRVSETAHLEGLTDLTAELETQSGGKKLSEETHVISSNCGGIYSQEFVQFLKKEGRGEFTFMPVKITKWDGIQKYFVIRAQGFSLDRAKRVVHPEWISVHPVGEDGTALTKVDARSCTIYCGDYEIHANTQDVYLAGTMIVFSRAIMEKLSARFPLLHFDPRLRISANSKQILRKHIEKPWVNLVMKPGGKGRI